MPAAATALGLGLVWLPGVAGRLGAPEVTVGGWILVGFGLVVGWAYARAVKGSLWVVRLGLLPLGVLASLGLVPWAATLLVAATAALTCLAWTPDARSATEPPRPRRGKPVSILPEVTPPGLMEAAGYSRSGTAPGRARLRMARLRYTFAVPVGLAGLIGGFIGGTVARVGCLDSSCDSLSILSVAVVSALVAAGGVGIVVVLADRSLREWRSESRDAAGGDLSAPQDARETEDDGGTDRDRGRRGSLWDMALVGMVVGAGATFVLGAVALGVGALTGRVPLILWLLLALGTLTLVGTVGLAITLIVLRARRK